MIDYKIVKNNDDYADGLSFQTNETDALIEWLDSNDHEENYGEIFIDEDGNSYTEINGSIFKLCRT